MPRYFFNLDGTAPDREGTILPSPQLARAAAVKLAGELLKDGHGRFWGAPDWRLHVSDDAGATVCALTIKGE